MKEKKNITSETINNTNPKRNPLATKEVWLPLKLSKIMSKNHLVKKNKIEKNPKKVINKP